MKTAPVVLYFGTFVEYKYERILKYLNIDYRPLNAVGIAKMLLSNTNSKILHLRYLQWRGYFHTLPLYLMLITLAKLRGVRIVWTCHNIEEHKIPSQIYGTFLRRLVYWSSDTVIIFHEALAQYLEAAPRKIQVANFGSYRPFILAGHDENTTFANAYRDWCKHRSISGPDLIFIGDYSARKNIELLYELAERKPDVNILIVSRGAPNADPARDNLFIHNTDRVFLELDAILKTPSLKAFVAHDNHSVPTSIHLYADYGIPCLALDIEPLSSLMKQYQAGVLFAGSNDFLDAWVELQANVNAYSAGIKLLAQDSTWEKAARCHARAFGAEMKDELL